MDLHPLIVKTVKTLRQYGLRTTLRKIFQHHTRSTTDNFDVRNGTDTSGIVDLWKVTIDSPNARFGIRYQATAEDELTIAVDFLRENLQTFTFIDLGCGKGRTLLIASKLGFKNAIGVEFVRELAEIARTNLAKMAITNAVVLHADAADFRFSDSDMVIYLYHPFSQEIMRRVVEHLGEFRSRKLYVIYNNPQCAEVLDSSGFLLRFGCPPGMPNIQVWRVADPHNRMPLQGKDVYNKGDTSPLAT